MAQTHTEKEGRGGREAATSGPKVQGAGERAAQAALRLGPWKKAAALRFLCRVAAYTAPLANTPLHHPGRRAASSSSSSPPGSTAQQPLQLCTSLRQPGNARACVSTLRPRKARVSRTLPRGQACPPVLVLIPESKHLQQANTSIPATTFLVSVFISKGAQSKAKARA